MEIQDSNSLRPLRKNIEACVDEILGRQSVVNVRAELSASEIDTVIANIMKTKEITALKQRYVENYEFCGPGSRNFIVNFDRPDLFSATKFETLFYHLTQNKSADVKNKELKTLLQYSTLDLIEKWPKISKILRECLAGKHKELFQSSLKLHIKLSSHPETINDASVNLTKTLISVFLGRRGQSASVDGGHILKMAHLLLHNVTVTTGNAGNTRAKQVEQFVTSFLELLSVRDVHSEKGHAVHFVHYIAVLDMRASWLERLLRNVVHRNTVLNFSQKTPAFVSFILTELLAALSSPGTEAHLKLPHALIRGDMLTVASLSHCAFVLVHLLCYGRGHRLFPVAPKASEKPVTVAGLAELLLQAVNSGVARPKRAVLVPAVCLLLTRNRHLLNARDMASALVRPLHAHLHEKHRLLEVARRNVHVLRVANEIAATRDGFLILFGLVAPCKWAKDGSYVRSVSLGCAPATVSSYIERYTKQQHQCSYSASERDHASVAKVIVEYTVAAIRHHLHKSKSVPALDAVVCELLACCGHMYQCHGHAPKLVNPRKLVQTAMHVYGRLVETGVSVASTAVCRFLCTVPGLEHLQADPDLLYVLAKQHLCSGARLSAEFLVNVLNTAAGSRAARACRRQFVAPHLERLWRAEEDELGFVSGSDRHVQHAVLELMKAMFTLTFSRNCVRCLLPHDDDDDEAEDDESTLVEADARASQLHDLLADALHASGPGTVACYAGLLALRMLVNNLDVFLFLERILHLQEQVQLAQAECTATHEYTAPGAADVIIDECSLLRQSILNFVQSVGAVRLQHTSPNMYRAMRPSHSAAVPSARSRRLNDLQRFLNDTRNNLHDHGWLHQARKTYRQCSGDTCKESVFVELVQQVRLTVPNTKSVFLWPDNEAPLADLFPEDWTGISVIVRYGTGSKLLQSSLQYEAVLALLLKQVQRFLNVDRSSYDGFDWFVGVVFLVCGGHVERTKIVLQCLVHLPVGPYLWPRLGEALSVQRKSQYASHFQHTLSILIEDLETCQPAFEQAGVSWRAFTGVWLRQCFFNVLEWSELCNVLAMAVLYPAEQLLYYVVCATQHTHARLLDSSDIAAYQSVFQLPGFRLHEWLPSMDQLGKQYRNVLSKY